MIACLFIGNNVMAQQTSGQNSKVISIPTNNITKHSKAAKSRNMPQLSKVREVTGTKDKKAMAKPVGTDIQLKGLEARLKFIEASDMTPAQKTTIKKRIQDRLDSLK